jgi:acetyl esterase/lipase
MQIGAMNHPARDPMEEIDSTRITYPEFKWRSLMRNLYAIPLCCATVAALLFLAPAARLQEPTGGKKTYTYKTVGACEIKADVYRMSEGKARPVVLWIHGGALIVGHRGQIDPVPLRKLLDAGYAVVSIDYRLAPETKLPAILDDVQDAYRWVREKGPGLFNIDPERIAVMGRSAGGYLTLTTGCRVRPRPAALVSLWGYGDVDGPWCSRPNPIYAKMPAVPKEEAYKAVGGRVISESVGKDNRSRFFLYCWQQGLWPKEVVGLDPDKEPKAFDPFCPVRNVTAEYPPTLLIHGTRDTDVPYEQSAQMAQELGRKGVVHELVTVKDAGHGLAGARPAVVAEAHERVLAFLKKHLR